MVSSTFIYFHWYKNKRLDLKNDVPGFSYSKTETEVY